MDFYDPAMPTEEDSPYGSPACKVVEPQPIDKPAQVEVKTPKQDQSAQNDAEEKKEHHPCHETKESPGENPTATSKELDKPAGNQTPAVFLPTDIPLPGQKVPSTKPVVTDANSVTPVSVLGDIPLPPTSSSYVPAKPIRPWPKIGGSPTMVRSRPNPHALGFEGKKSTIVPVKPKPVQRGAEIKPVQIVPKIIPSPGSVVVTATTSMKMDIEETFDDDEPPPPPPPPPSKPPAETPPMVENVQLSVPPIPVNVAQTSNNSHNTIPTTVKPPVEEPALTPAQKLIMEARANQLQNATGQLGVSSFTKHSFGIGKKGSFSLGLKQKNLGVKIGAQKEVDSKVCFQIKAVKRLVAYTDDSESPTEGETSESDVNPSPARPGTKLSEASESKLSAPEQQSSDVMVDSGSKGQLLMYPIMSKVGQQKALAEHAAQQIQEKLNSHNEQKRELENRDVQSRRDRRRDRSRSSERRRTHTRQRSRSNSPSGRRHSRSSSNVRRDQDMSEYKKRRKSHTPDRELVGRRDRSYSPENRHKPKKKKVPTATLR